MRQIKYCKTDRVVSAVLGARRVCSACRREVAHGEVARELEAVAHVRLPPAQHRRVDGDGEGGVAGRQGTLDQLRRDDAVLKRHVWQQNRDGGKRGKRQGLSATPAHQCCSSRPAVCSVLP